MTESISVGALPAMWRERALRAEMRGARLAAEVRKECADELAEALKVGAEARTGGGWQPLTSAPKDGTIFDVYFGNKMDDESEELVRFYCTPSTRRSPAWHYRQGKFRPHVTLGVPIVSIQPTHWMLLPSAPTERP